MLTEKRVPLSVFLQGAGGLEPEDGVVVLVAWWRPVLVRLAVWAKVGVVFFSGSAVLLARGKAFDRMGFTVAVVVLALLALPLIAVVYPRSLPTRWHQRVCWVEVGGDLPRSLQAAAPEDVPLFVEVRW